jgi:hypothetical protein
MQLPASPGVPTHESTAGLGNCQYGKCPASLGCFLPPVSEAVIDFHWLDPNLTNGIFSFYHLPLFSSPSTSISHMDSRPPRFRDPQLWLAHVLILKRATLALAINKSKVKIPCLTRYQSVPGLGLQLSELLNRGPLSFSYWMEISKYSNSSFDFGQQVAFGGGSLVATWHAYRLEA